MRYIHGDISHFLYKSIKRGKEMTAIVCWKSKCLNNRNGECSADVIEYDGLCQSYITAKHSCKAHCGICRKDKGKLKRKGGEILK